VSDPSTRPVLVTGATGFTGNHLVRALAKAGLPVRAIVRATSRATGLPPGVDVRQVDLTNPAAVAQAVEGTGIIFHLAAAFREAAHRDQGYWEINVGATRNLLEAAARQGVERFVHCSTVGVLGHIDQPPADETTPYSPGDIYQRTKCEGEMLALGYARERGLAVSVARPTAIYGPGDTRLLKMFRMIANGTFVMLGLGEIYYHMVYVDDLVEGLRLMAVHPEAVGEVFILGGEGYYPLTAIAGMIAQNLGVRRPRLRLPAWPFQLAGSLCERICVPLGVEPPIYRRRVDFFTKSRAFSIAKAKQLLGYRPLVGLEAGLRKTVAWYRSNGHLALAASLATIV